MPLHIRGNDDGKTFVRRISHPNFSTFSLSSNAFYEERITDLPALRGPVVSRIVVLLPSGICYLKRSSRCQAAIGGVY